MPSSINLRCSVHLFLSPCKAQTSKSLRPTNQELAGGRVKVPIVRPTLCVGVLSSHLPLFHPSIFFVMLSTKDTAIASRRVAYFLHADSSDFFPPDICLGKPYRKFKIMFPHGVEPSDEAARAIVERLPLREFSLHAKTTELTVSGEKRCSTRIVAERFGFVQPQAAA